MFRHVQMGILNACITILADTELVPCARTSRCKGLQIFFAMLHNPNVFFSAIAFPKSLTRILCLHSIVGSGLEKFLLAFLIFHAKILWKSCKIFAISGNFWQPKNDSGCLEIAKFYRNRIFWRCKALGAISIGEIFAHAGELKRKSLNKIFRFYAGDSKNMSFWKKPGVSVQHGRWNRPQFVYVYFIVLFILAVTEHILSISWRFS